MPRYRRRYAEGGTFFFTVTLADRSSDLLVREVDRLRRIYRSVERSRPFETVAICILPDHLHAIWTLPEDDVDYPLRWSLIKSGFTRGLDFDAYRSQSKDRRRERGIWQRRYWEHAIRDDDDLLRHPDYIHYNPVKHRLVTRAADWAHSSIYKFIRRGEMSADWGGDLREFDGYGE